MKTVRVLTCAAIAALTCAVPAARAADDAFEPNDSIDAAAPLGAVGLVRSALVLSAGDEDWFSVTLAADAASLAADVKYDQAATGATVVVEIHDALGATLATSNVVTAQGAVHAVGGPAPAGTYRIGVRHVAGATVPTYVFQTYVPPSLPAAPVHDWTLGRDYDRPLGYVGGIPPFAATIQNGQLPLGMNIDSISVHAVGRPNVIGTFPITVQVTDSGNPQNVVQQTENLVVHDVLRLPPAPFLGFEADRTLDFDLPTTGGTPPFALSATAGALPAGLAILPGTLHVKGKATSSPASTLVDLDAVDFAGSADHVTVRAVVCGQIAAKNIPAHLANGADACGWWFDAVQGSTVTFTVKTQRAGAFRNLDGALLAPDRAAVTSGAIRGRVAGVSASRLVCPLSGRYFFVAFTDDEGLATTLLGTVSVATKRSGKATRKDFTATETTSVEIGALPGSTTTLTFTGDKKAKLVAKIVSITDPSGADVPSAGLVKPSALGGRLTLPMTTGGTWKIVLGATSGTVSPGRFTYSYSVKQAKGAVYSAD